MTTLLYPKDPVLLVDDEMPVLKLFEAALRSSGINHIVTINDARQVLAFLEKQPVSALMLDLYMPHLSGDQLLPQVVVAHPSIPIIVVTGANDVEVAVRCMKSGAQDYLVKPVEDSRLASCVRRVVELHDLQQENRRLQHRLLSEALDNPDSFEEIITVDRKMFRLFQYIDAIALTTHPVLITGETGVGKELFARAVHRASGRSGPFVPVNIAGLDDNLFSDALFGHFRGAFTGADETRQGMVEAAANGTLFLDEIGDLNPPSQVKLLRLIQEREFFPLGSTAPKRSNARIVVATHQDVEALRSSGRMRQDLYYRLTTHHVHVLPLRDRRDDLPVLVDHFMEMAAHALERPKPAVPGELIDLLMVYDFPGNVRELEAMIVDAVSTHRSGILSLESFRQRVGLSVSSPRTSPGFSHLAPIESARDFPTLRIATGFLIEEAMRLAQGNQALAARLLGISRPALNRRLNHPRGEQEPEEEMV